MSLLARASHVFGEGKDDGECASYWPTVGAALIEFGLAGAGWAEVPSETSAGARAGAEAGLWMGRSGSTARMRAQP
jgi:hypothetical protein